MADSAVEGIAGSDVVGTAGHSVVEEGNEVDVEHL